MMMQPVLVPNPRRLSAVASGHANLAVSGLALPPNVIRLPRGPSKGKGFQNWCKTRMQPAAPAAAPAPAVNNNLVVNLESSDSDEGHFSDHDLDGAPHENERTR